MNRLHHNEYEAVVSFDEEAALFHGEVVDLRDVVTFQSRTVAGLEQAFADSIADYVAFCQRCGAVEPYPS